MKTRFWVVSLGVALSLGLVLLAPAAQQAQHSSQGDATIKVNTNLVILDVTVLDKSGKVVSGLGKNDFTVLEDGKAQKVSVFEFQKLENDKAAPALPAPPALMAGGSAIPKVAITKQQGIAPSKPGAVRFQDRRLVVMLFDLASMQPDDQVHANEAATKFINSSLQPNDVVAIMVNSTSLQVAQDFTNDKDQLLAVIKSFSVGQNSDLANAGTTGDMTTGEDTGAAFESDETESNIFSTDQKLVALETAAKMLASLPEKKALVYFSAGVGKSGMDNQAQLRSTVAAAVRSNVAFYPIDISGLVALPPGGDATHANGRGNSMFTGAAQASQKQSFDDKQETLVTLAEDTGGKAFLDSNDVAGEIKDARDDVHSYYILGFYSTNEKEDGKFRRIQVKINKPGLQAKLDYRDGYYADKTFKKFTGSDKETQLQEALLLGDPLTDVPLAVEADYFRLGLQTYYVPISVRVPGSVIPMVKKGSKEQTQIDFIGQIYNSHGSIVEKLRDYIEVKVDDETAAQIAKRSLQYDAGFTLPPGAYTIKVLARENLSGKMGTYEGKFVIPNLNAAGAGSLRVSSVVWSNQRESVKAAVGGSLTDRKGIESDPLIQNGEKLVPNIRKVFRTDQNLYVYMEVYDPAPDPSVAAALTFYRGRVKAYQSAPVRLTETMSNRAGVMPVRFQIPLSALAPGKYTCQVNVIDEKAAKFAFPRTELMVVKSAPPAAAPKPAAVPPAPVKPTQN
jgi:VWFA-related protein